MSTADKLNKLLETKQAIKQAIIDKGVDVSDDTVFAEYPTKINAIEGASNIDLSNYVTKDELPTVPTNVSEFNNDAGYLTEHQDISHLATEQYVNDAINNIEIPEVDLSEHYTKAETDALLIKKANAGHHHNTLYYTEAEVDSMFNGLALDQYTTYKWVKDWTSLTFAPIKHTHEDYATKEELNNALGDIESLLGNI